MSESSPESCGSSEGINSHQGNSKPPVRRTQTSLGVPEHRPHLPVTRCSSSPHDQTGQRQVDPSSLQRLHSQSGVISAEDLAGRPGHPASLSHEGKPCGRSGGWSHYLENVKGIHTSHSSPSLSTHQPGGLSPQASPQPPQNCSPAPQTVAPVPGPGEGTVPSSPEWQRERWQIWQLLSTDSADALPETLV